MTDNVSTDDIQRRTREALRKSSLSPVDYPRQTILVCSWGTDARDCPLCRRIHQAFRDHAREAFFPAHLEYYHRSIRPSLSREDVLVRVARTSRAVFVVKDGRGVDRQLVDAAEMVLQAFTDGTTVADPAKNRVNLLLVSDESTESIPTTELPAGYGDNLTLTEDDIPERALGIYERVHRHDGTKPGTYWYGN